MGKRIGYIDGLRGFAALAVVCGHWADFLGRTSGNKLLRDVSFNDFNLGRMSVVAFFCVSGFVIPFSFRGERPLVSFVISRFFRLYPAYWLSLIAALALLDGPFQLSQILANVTMAQNAIGKPGVLGVYWTLAVELAFYVDCFVLAAAGVLRKPALHVIAMALFIGLGLAGAVMVGLNHRFDPPLGLPTYLAAMHFGALTRLATLEREETAKAALPFALAGVVIAVIAINAIAYYDNSGQPIRWLAAITSYVVGLGLFLLCVYRQWFGHKHLMFLGAISYGVYLFHPIYLPFAEEIYRASPNLVEGVLLYLPILLASTMVTAYLVYEVVEMRMHAVGRRANAVMMAALDKMGC